MIPAQYQINEKTSISEIAAIVSQALRDHGIDSFLSGGAVVSIYTKNKYESYDLDFISFEDRKKIKNVMLSLGFETKRSRLFEHPKSKYFVEFPGTATLIGNQPITDFEEIQIKGNTLKLLTPTDCVKDRLAAYIHWNDQQGISQAALVATAAPCDLEQIFQFCKDEGNATAYSDFIKKLKSIKQD